MRLGRTFEFYSDFTGQGRAYRAYPDDRHRVVTLLEDYGTINPVASRARQFRGRVARELLFVSDVRLGERIGVGTDHGARLRDIEAGCRQVAAQWGGIKPRASIFAKPEGPK